MQLAEMLNITDKAVIKWESCEGNHDISMLPKLTKLFGVTFDYFLTGIIPEEKVNLDDMDYTNRAIYLIKKKILRIQNNDENSFYFVGECILKSYENAKMQNEASVVKFIFNLKDSIDLTLYKYLENI